MSISTDCKQKNSIVSKKAQIAIWKATRAYPQEKEDKKKRKKWPELLLLGLCLAQPLHDSALTGVCGVHTRQSPMR